MVWFIIPVLFLFSKDWIDRMLPLHYLYTSKDIISGISRHLLVAFGIDMEIFNWVLVRKSGIGWMGIISHLHFLPPFVLVDWQEYWTIVQEQSLCWLCEGGWVPPIFWSFINIMNKNRLEITWMVVLLNNRQKCWTILHSHNLQQQSSL